MGLNRNQLKKLWAMSTTKQRDTIITKGIKEGRTFAKDPKLRQDDKEHVVRTEFDELPFWAIKIIRRGVD